MPPRSAFGMPRFDQQRRRQPRSRRGHVAQRGAPSSTSPSTAPSSSPENSGATPPPRRPPRSSMSGRRTPGPVVPVSPTAPRKGRRQEHGRDPRRRGPYGIQVNGLVPGLMPHEDMTDDIQGNLVRTHDKDATQPALRVGQRQELGWAATFLVPPSPASSPATRSWSTAPTGSAGASPIPRSSPCATRWAGVRSSRETTSLRSDDRGRRGWRAAGLTRRSPDPPAGRFGQSRTLSPMTDRYTLVSADCHAGADLHVPRLSRVLVPRRLRRLGRRLLEPVGGPHRRVEDPQLGQRGASAPTRGRRPRRRNRVPEHHPAVLPPDGPSGVRTSPHR